MVITFIFTMMVTMFLLLIILNLPDGSKPKQPVECFICGKCDPPVAKYRVDMPSKEHDVKDYYYHPSCLEAGLKNIYMLSQEKQEVLRKNIRKLTIY